jgi:hypothetical protein
MDRVSKDAILAIPSVAGEMATTGEKGLAPTHPHGIVQYGGDTQSAGAGASAAAAAVAAAEAGRERHHKCRGDVH